MTNHGTHVGGVIASHDEDFMGAAPGINSLSGGTESRLLGFDHPGGKGAADPAEILNLSFGSRQTNDAADAPRDVLISLLDLGYAASAGNDNGDGAPTVANIGRNQLVMAGYNDGNTLIASDDVILGVSSRGPTPGGRKKPDLIAPGGSIMAPDIKWNDPPSHPDFTGMSGTSVAAPFGASALALLEGAGIGDSAAQRAILINSARDWTGSDAGITHGWTPGGQGSWQPEVGWGVLDLEAALADRGNYELGSVEEGSARFFRANSATGSKTTLAWELRGTWPNYPANGSQPIEFTTSNLDLRQYRADTLLEAAPPADPGHGGGPDAVDPNDTVEQVRSPGGGQMIYKVSSESTVEGLDAEPFAIASTEALTPLVNPEVEPFGSTVKASGPVSCSSEIGITTNLRNQSPDLDAAEARVTLQLPRGVELVAGDQSRSVADGTLGADTGSSAASWTVRASTDGMKTLSIVGSGAAMGETFISVEKVRLDADCSPPSTSIDSGPSGPTNARSPTFEFSADEPASFSCSIDGGAFSQCDAPLTLRGLGEGPHNLAVRATDAAGNPGGIASRDFIVDRTPPVTRLSSGPRGATREVRPSFSFTSPDAAGAHCALDDTEFAPCRSPVLVGPLADGPHVFRVRSIDAAGNLEPDPAARRFEVDTELSGARVRFDRRQRPPRRKPKVKLRAGAAEAVLARASGKARLPGRDARLAAASGNAAPAKLARLKLKPKSRRDTKRIRKRLARRGRVNARIKVRLTDRLGNRERKRFRIRLKPRA